MKIVPTILLVFYLTEQTTSGKLLLILLDGFRWDYFNQGLNLPAFRKIFDRGVKAERLIPAYPSVSYPNHYTLLTGLYAESHGFVGNEIYDVTTGKLYAPWYTNLTSDDRSFMYDGAEPLWITAVKQNKRVYMFHWVGCEATIQGRKPTFCRKKTDVPTVADFRRDLNDSLELFKNSSADLAVVYFEKIDDFGHRYGPEADQVNSVIQDVDTELGRMLTKITESGLESEVDVMIFSDHGMTSVSQSRVVNISNILPTSSVDIVVNGYGSHVYIWPKEGHEDEVYTVLMDERSHYTVYRKENIPESWHFRSNKRIPPILLAAELSWYIDTPNFGFYSYDTGPMNGEHGFDPNLTDMSGIFTAFGPSFVSGGRTEYLSNVDLYQIMCHILGVEPRSHNGTWSRVSPLMPVSGSPWLQTTSWLLPLLLTTSFYVTEH